MIGEFPIRAIFVGALIVRIVATLVFSGTIDAEGAEYGRIAENILANFEYRGITASGAQLFFPPLYPLLTAAGALGTGQVEVAGRLISIVAGALLVFPTYSIAARLYRKRIGVIAAFAVALHPYLIYMSTKAYSESLYVFLIYSAIAIAAGLMHRPASRQVAIAGAVFGMAFLVRQEAVAYVVVVACLIAVSSLVYENGSWKLAIKRAGLILAAFVIVIAPYVAWLSIKTGGLRLEAKSPLNIITQLRIQEGEGPLSAHFAITPSGQERGAWNRPNIEVIKGFSLSPIELAKYASARLRSVLEANANMLAADLLFGSPALFALAVIGLFSRPYDYEAMLTNLLLASFLVLVPVGTFFIYFFNPRFYIAYVPLLCIWGAAGIPAVRSWALQTAETSLGVGSRTGRWLAAGAVASLVGCVLLPSAGLAISTMLYERAHRPLKWAVETLERPGGSAPRMLSSLSDVSFHAKAHHFWLPYADEESARKYISQNKIDYVVIRQSDSGKYPYANRWLREGIGFPNAALLMTVNLGRHDRVHIFKVN